MNLEEALAWLSGERSWTNIIPQDPLETWMLRIAKADAASTEQAYWTVRGHNEFHLMLNEYKKRQHENKESSI